MKCVFFMPRRSASRFISMTKFVSVPPTASASTSAASLPDCTIRPCAISRTEAGLPGCRNMRDSSVLTVRTLSVGVIIWSYLSLPSRTASKTR